MPKSRNLIIIILIFIAFTQVKSQGVYEFLRLDSSPRAAALAGSFVANHDDPNVMFYNPAGIKNLQKRPVSFSFLKHLLDINYASLSFSSEIQNYGRFAAGVQYINYGDFTEADDFGNKTGSFGAGDFAFTLGYANRLDNNFNYGINFKLIYSKLADRSSVGLASDLGLQYLIPEGKWSFGFSILNIGSQISQYYNTSEDLPLDMQLGLSKELKHVPFKFYLSFKKLNEAGDGFSDRFSSFLFGWEISLSEAVQLRVGYDNEKRDELKLGTSAGLGGFNFGFGINIDKYNFDYAFSSMGSIGALHRIGITTAF
jgi:hypothetical protein